MEQTKLKSLRIPVSTLEQVDAFCKQNRWAKPHAVMVTILENIFSVSDYQTLKSIFHYWKHSNKKMHIIVTFDE